MGIIAERKNLTLLNGKTLKGTIDNLGGKQGSGNISSCLCTSTHTPSEFSHDYGTEKSSSAGYRKQLSQH